MLLLAIILETTGTLLIAYAALNVHHRFYKEHKVDEAVYNEMKKERKVGIAGIALVLVSFVIQVGLAIL